MSGRLLTFEQEEHLREILPGKTFAEAAAAMKTRYGLDLSVAQMRNLAYNHGISGSVAMPRPGRPRRCTVEPKKERTGPNPFLSPRGRRQWGEK